MLTKRAKPRLAWLGRVFSSRVEDSWRLWALGLASLWLAALGLLRAGGNPWLALGAAAAGTAGYWMSWRRRNGHSRVLPILICGLVIALSFVMRSQMLEAFTGNWLPLGQFLLLVQALSSFDLRTRGGLYTALGLTGIILFFAGQQAFSANFAICFVIYVVVLLAFLAVTFLEDGLRDAQVHWARRQPVIIAYWISATCAVFALSWLAFWLMPRSRDDLLGRNQVSILPFSGRSVEGGDAAIPSMDPSTIPASLADPGAPSDPAAPAASSDPEAATGISLPGEAAYENGGASGSGAPSNRFMGLTGGLDAPTGVVFYVRSRIISYWRGQALESFDGRYWQAGSAAQALVPSQEQPGVWFDPASLRLNSHLRYNQTFFIQQDAPGALFLGYRGLRVSAPELALGGNGPVSAAEGLRQGDAYRVVSAHPDFDPEKLALDRAGGPATNNKPRFTQLPAGSERLRELARQVTQGAEGDFAKAERLAGYLAQRGTLRPQQPGDLSTAVSPDEFLFEGQPGSTLDYATAMVLLARAAGLPSRLAVGYLPGGRDPLSGAYMVRERDAHAWAEVYFARHGWVPFDSAPRAGLALPGRGGSTVARLFRTGVGDEAFQWVRSAPSRIRQWGPWLQRLAETRLLYGLGPLLALGFLALHWRRARRKGRPGRRTSPLLKYLPLPGETRRELRRVYAQVERLLRRRGAAPRQSWETVGHYTSLPNDPQPEVQRQLSWFAGAMQQASYDPAEAPPGMVWEARRRLERLKRALARRE